jgi:hypothetical protein
MSGENQENHLKVTNDEIELSDAYYQELQKRREFLSYDYNRNIKTIKDILNLYHTDKDHKEISDADKKLLLDHLDNIVNQSGNPAPELTELLKLAIKLDYDNSSAQEKQQYFEGIITTLKTNHSNINDNSIDENTKSMAYHNAITYANNLQDSNKKEELKKILKEDLNLLKGQAVDTNEEFLRKNACMGMLYYELARCCDNNLEQAKEYLNESIKMERC